jgi:anti-sigma-K factor RskA
MVKQLHVVDELPAYALDSLSTEEKRMVEAHLKGCAECRAELLAYQELVGSLAFTVPQVNPPPRLKQAIMSQVSPRPSRPGLLAVLRGWFAAPAFRVASLALILVLVASNIFFINRINQLSDMQRHGFGSVALSGTQYAPKASGLMIYTNDGRYGLMVVNGLGQLPDGKQYQLWLTKDGMRTSGGVFSVSKYGYFVMEVRTRTLLTSYDSFGITIEPTGGSTAPTGDKVLGGKF